MRTTIAILCLISGGNAFAVQRTSANYSILADTADTGGGIATSVNYSNAGSAGLIAGVSSAPPAGTAKHGYVAQLFDIAGVVVNSSAPFVNEGASLKLAAWQLLDDATFLAVDAGAVTWGIVDGPIAGISVTGLADAGLVYQDTAATVQGTLSSFTGSLNLTVLDSIPDNFGAYAGDGIGDAWQVQYFGQDNPLAAPGVDADDAGQNNLFEFLAGSTPIDPGSLLTTTAISMDGGNFTIQLSRVQPGTHYVFERSADFITWTDILSLDPIEIATPFSQLLPANGPQNFFRVRLEAAP